MRIIIVGAGTVGESIARTLCSHHHDVTIIDKTPGKLEALNNSLDALVLEGNGSHASVLFQADAMNADLCLALTNSDEVNLVVASLAKAMGTRRTVARVYAPLANNLVAFDYCEHFDIDKIISLEQLTALRLSHEIDQFTEALNLETYLYGDIELMEFEIQDGAKSVGVRIRDLSFPSNVRVGSILRNGVNFIPRADDLLNPGDQITLFGEHDSLIRTRKNLGGEPPQTKNIIIAGGGETGLHLAQLIQKRHHVRLLETDLERCHHLASVLDRNVEVVNIDVQCRSALEEERVGAADVFVACTGYDENNLLVCVEAKELGAERVYSVINRADYGNVITKLGIDFCVSPREEAGRKVLNFLNTGAIISNDGIFGDKIRLLEIKVEKGSLVSSTPLRHVGLPPQCIVVAAVHHGSVSVPGADFTFREGDTAVVITHNQHLEQVLDKFESR
ncbi:MAG: Trk system potassium transporter TrkA [Planctomycetia bacterium]|nr:Trk system potassium transporter TrkA [Planctomycetia bacterium]